MQNGKNAYLVILWQKMVSTLLKVCSDELCGFMHSKDPVPGEDFLKADLQLIKYSFPSLPSVCVCVCVCERACLFAYILSRYVKTQTVSPGATQTGR